ncbi:MAG: peptide deformylase [Thiotrichales bacterium]|jgi:peptide deformylase|nr:peptide deformylase [Thiotrichales bacterium]MBT3613632.1 peptide deformylase [Thiotrichales bacterium]MBT3752609.1 peptide deformylase [Thiotrichales bacterium]MBT3837948.1 peptide deformylase [Thiotrichales bacterium]MBT4152162.1 peptide deformylase [Thiotrichales bacterium]
MALLKIIKHPDPKLRKKAAAVTEITPELLTLADDMLETMYAAPGIGLAATQIGRQLSLVVIDISEEKDQPLTLINPLITKLSSGVVVNEEGCLSVPGIYEEVERAESVTLNYTNSEGEEIELETDGVLAICIQHELEHLDGKLFVDHLSRLKQERIRKKLLKQQKESM